MSLIGRFLGAEARNKRNVGFYLPFLTSGFKFARRIMSPRQRTLLRFEVKPGDAFEIRGVRRGR